MRIGQIVGLVSFLSLAFLGWWVLWWGWSWQVGAVGGFWLVLGAMAVIDPGEWKKRP